MSIIPYFYDLGTYAAILGLFAAWVSYRANPTRSVNRLFTLVLLDLALWQTTVALARVTKNYSFWAIFAAPHGGILLTLIFLLHDAVLHPNASLITRLRRTPLPIFNAILFTVASALAYTANYVPSFYPLYLRLICLSFLCLTFFAAHRQRRLVGRTDSYEVFLFNLTSVVLLAILSVFTIIRLPIGSRINSVLAILLLLIVIALQVSDKVLDARATAKLALGYLLTFATHFLLLAVIFFVVTASGVSFATLSPWLFAFLCTVLNYPLFVYTQPILQRALSSLTAKPAAEARANALQLVNDSHSDVVITRGLAVIARDFLGGSNLTVHPLRSNGAMTELGPARTLLADAAVRGWLTPADALRQYRKAELDQLLTTFHEEQIGAVIVHRSQHVTLVFFAAQRAGGSKPIRAEEIELLQEIASIGAAGYERVRALEETFRTRGLATVGRLAAQYSHEARNSLAAILSALEALRDGQEATLSPHYRSAVYQQAADLAANHDLALEITRLRPDRLTLAPCALPALLQQTADAYAPIARKSGAVFFTQTDLTSLTAIADPKLLRQVLLNLLINSVQACVAAGITPRIIMRAWPQSPETVCIDVVDNGPGVASDLRDQLFASGVTTKPDGTGLGLSFCLEAMRSLNGSITYISPESSPGAIFRLSLPASRTLLVYGQV
jgi:signal transduction histidine kinase